MNEAAWYVPCFATGIRVADMGTCLIVSQARGHVLCCHSAAFGLQHNSRKLHTCSANRMMHHAALPSLVCLPGSWDALGVHYATSGGEGSWADNQIINLVKQHNKSVK